MVKAMEVTQVRYKPYATIERTNFSTAIVFDKLVSIENLINVNINMAHKNYARFEF